MSPKTNVWQILQFLVCLVDFTVVLLDSQIHGVVQGFFRDENQHNCLLDVGVLPHVVDV